MHVFNNLFRHRYLIQDVFTPTSAAKLTYIDRKQLDDDLRRALNIPGMQVILYGYSGGGKTTLIENELAKNNRRYISTICNSDTSVDQLVLVALDKLELYYTSQKTHTGSTSASFGLSAKYFSLRGLINEKAEVVEKRAIPIQLTPQRLAEFLGDIECIWVVEDFHKVPEVEKRKFAQMLKTFVDISNKYKKTKTICIGAVGTAREVVSYDRELSNRVSEIYVPLLSEEELGLIIDKGCELLNIYISSPMRDQIISYANNLASICHQLCYNICEASGIQQTSRILKKIDDSKLEEAVKNYVRQSSDTFNKIVDRALRQRKGEYENAKVILQAMIDLQEESLSHSQILKKIKESHKNYPAGNLTNYARILTTQEFGEILRYDRNSDKYLFANPFIKAFIRMRFDSERKRKKKKKSYAKHFLVDLQNEENIRVIWQSYLSNVRLIKK